MTKRSLQSKLVFSFIFLMILLLVCLGIFNLFFAKEYYVYRTAQTMEQAFTEIQKNYTGEVESVEEIILYYEDNYNFDIKLNDEYDNSLYSTSDRFRTNSPAGNPPAGNPAGANLPHTVQEEVDISFPQVRVQVSEYRHNNTTVLRMVEEFDNGAGLVKVHMFVTVSSLENSVNLFTGVSSVITCVVLVLGLLLFYFISRSITKPIGDIQRTAARISALDFSAKIEEKQSSTELSSLAKSINSMSGQLEQTIKDLNTANEQLQSDIDTQKKMESMRKEFVANVSHEMKTPLALLQIYADNLQNNLEGIDKEEYCQVIIEESEKLSDMVSSMLDIASLENGLSVLQKEPICISDFCTQFSIKIKPLAETQVFSQNIEKNLWVLANEQYLEQAMKNYISNAIEHTTAGASIELCLRKEDDMVVFSVFNEGSHINEEDFPHIWSSFYRSDKARVRQDGNVGMGLHIVNTILKQHNGHCEAKNCETGVIFSFSIPLFLLDD